MLLLMAGSIVHAHAVTVTSGGMNPYLASKAGWRGLFGFLASSRNDRGALPVHNSKG